jgi:hypothetical protein
MNWSIPWLFAYADQATFLFCISVALYIGYMIGARN